MRGRVAAVLLAGLLFAGTGWAQGVAGGSPPQALPPRVAQVTYVTGDQVYVSAGRLDGLAEGRELQVVRGRSDSVVATLQVLYVSSHQSACKIARGAADVAAGDRVRYTSAVVVAAAPAPTGAPAAGAPARSSPRGRSSPGLHGRVAARYVWTREIGIGRFAQPAFDARLMGVGLGGTALGLVADVRGRATMSSLVAGSSLGDGQTDVYQLALLWNQPGAPVRMAIGRQYLTTVSSIVLLDGVLSEVSSQRVGLGVFGGAEPAPDGFGFSAAVRDYGGYLQLRSARGSSAPWMITTGVVGSYRSGLANREFGFLQASYSSRAFTFNASQEVDYYRSVKQAAGEPRVSFTSSYVSASLHPGALRLDAGVNSRRNVRLYSDVANPITAFDDRYRRAAWGAVGLSGRRLRFRVEGRTTGGGTSGRATALTASVGADRVAPFNLGVSARVTRYRSTLIAGETSGWLESVRLGADPIAPLHLELTGGERREANPLLSPGLRRTVWYGGEADVGIARAWFLLASANRETGPDGPLDQAYVSLSYRF
jgi:hypothetical protein